jgi:hypothetical protein
MATDIGICLGRILKGKPNEAWKLKLQLPLLASFFAGGVCGCLAHDRYAEYAMFIPVVIFGGIGAAYVAVIAHARQESLYSALWGGDDNPFSTDHSRATAPPTHHGATEHTSLV